MGKLILAITLVSTSVAAQPDPQPAPQAPEKAGSDETLQKGGDDRPWAKGVSPEEQKAALDLFHDGNEKLNNGLFGKAIEQYMAALKHWDHPAIHYNLALAQMNLDQPIEAYENLTASVKFGEAPLQSKDKFDHAKEYVVLLEKQIADIEVSCDKAGAKVLVDGKEAFTAPGTFKSRVKIGKHTFVADKAGYRTRINAPFIGPGEHFRIELKLYTAEELTRYHRRWQTTWLPYAVAGGGAVLVLAGGLFEALAGSNYRDYDKQVADCNSMAGGNAGCQHTTALDDLRTSGDAKRSTGFVMYGIGAAAIATGAVLYWLNRPSAYQIKPEELQTDVTFAPVVAPGFAGGTVRGSF